MTDARNSLSCCTQLRIGFTLAFVAFGSLFFQDSFSLEQVSLPTYSFATRSLTENSRFNWGSITPSEKIVWTNCYKGHQCARLLLPLDYLTPGGPKTTIALRMLPAANGPYGKNAASYKGPIIVNPGGPGEAGTTFIGNSGEMLSTVVGPDFDVIGFDPRGTGFSYPTADCFENRAQAASGNLGGLNPLKPGDGSIPSALMRIKIVQEDCLKALGGKFGPRGEQQGESVDDWGIGRFLSTTSVATDMARMVELLGQTKLYYWGFSYGTVLAQYFAAMYPEKVGRIVIDGVLNAITYRSETWANITPDIEAAFDTFFTLCSQAGSAKCPVYAPDASDIRKRVFGVLDRLEKDPIPVPLANKGPSFLTSSRLRKNMLASVYKPLLFFPLLAKDIIAIEENDQARLAQLVDEDGCCQVPRLPNTPGGSEAHNAISCGDGDPFTTNEADVADFVRTKSKVSPLFASLLSINRLGCSGWPIRPRWRYEGPFMLPSNISLSSSSDSSPILLISTQYDPICPLSDARTVHQRYGASNSRLIVQNSAGHTSVSSPSACTQLRVRAYFQGGHVPAEGEPVICHAQEAPFVGKLQVNDGAERDEELERSLERYRQRVPFFPFPYFYYYPRPNRRPHPVPPRRPPPSSRVSSAHESSTASPRKQKAPSRAERAERGHSDIRKGRFASSPTAES